MNNTILERGIQLQTEIEQTEDLLNVIKTKQERFLRKQEGDKFKIQILGPCSDPYIICKINFLLRDELLPLPMDLIFTMSVFKVEEKLRKLKEEFESL